MAANDEIFITVKGQGGHGALRQHIKDPILMASQILLSLQDEVSRMAPGDSPTVLSFGKVLADGATNVVPDEVILEGTFRTMNEAWRKEGHRLIEKVASDIASSRGGSVEVEIRKGYPVLYNNEEIARESKKLATELLGVENVEEMNSTPNRISIKASGPGRLVLSEINYPGWKVFVDGNQEEIKTTYGLLRSIDLAEGSHKIEFSFQPLTVYAGLGLAVVGWVLVSIQINRNKK